MQAKTLCVLVHPHISSQCIAWLDCCLSTRRRLRRLFYNGFFV